MKIGRLNRASFAKTARRAMFLFAFAVLGTQAATVATVNGTGYETLEAAIAAAEPVDGVVTYEICGKAEVSATGWIQVLKSGLSNVKKVAFVGTTKDAEICIAGGLAILADQQYDIDVSFRDLKLSKPNPEYGGDYGHSTNYFTTWLRNPGAAENTVTYENCTFPNGACNNQYGKTVYTNCTFANGTTGLYNLWIYGGSVEMDGGEFTGTRGMKVYTEGTPATAPSVEVKGTAFSGLTEKAAIVVSKAATVKFAEVSVADCSKGLFQKDIEGSLDDQKVTVTANGSKISGSFEITANREPETAKTEFNITGGMFTAEVPSDYCADGFTVKATTDADGNTVYGVVEAAFVTVTGIAGFADRKYASFAEAYAAIKPTIEKLGLVQESATADAFDALFTSVDANGNATLTYTISGTVVYDETDCANLLTMGRKASHYGNGRHLINFKFVGATGKEADTLTVNSDITLPYEWWSEKTMTGIHFENLTITGPAPSGLYPSQKFFEGIDFSVTKCALKGIKIYNCSNVKGSYTITDSVLDGTGAPANSYAIHLQGNETAPLSINIKGNTISGYDRGINIDQKTAVATIEGNTISVTDTGRSCIQLSSLATADIVGNTLELTGGNAITLHENLLKLSAAPEVSISGNKVTGTGYLIYDDAKANDKEFTSDNLKLTYAADNVVDETVNTTQGVKGSTEYALSGTVATTLHSVDFAAFVKALTDAGYTFDGSKHALAQGGKLTVKWSPVSGCYDKREGHECTVGNVAATANTPKRVNSGLTQFQLFEGESHAVNVKNVAFVYEPAAFTVCENSGWKGTFTAEQAPAGQIYLMSTGNVTFEGCSFDKVVLTSFNCTGTSTVTNCSFKNVYNSYAVKDIRGKKVAVTGCTFENCGAAVMVSSTVKVEEVTISGNTFKNVDVAGTTPDDKVGTRGLVQIASSGDYAGTAFDFSDNKATDCGPVLRQLNTTVSFGTEEKAQLNTLASAGGSLYTTDSIKRVVAKVGETAYETLDEAIKAVRDGETIVVNAGEYKLNGSLTYTGKAFTIQAAEGAKVSFDMSGAVALHGAKITFAGVTFDYKTNGNYIGLQHADTLVYNDCTINGMVFLYAASETFNRCTFNQTSAGAYNVWTYGAKEVAFNVCTFNCVGKSVLVYNEGANTKTDLAVSDCEFKASAPVEGKAAIEIDTSLMAGGATITVDAKTTAEGFAEGSNSKSTLWNDKKQTQDTNRNTTVTVAGETVFTPVVAQVGTAGYTTLAAAFAALSAENHTLTLLNEGAWDAATPVYWAAGAQNGYVATFTAALTAAYKANAGAITIVCRPGADVGEMTHGHVADDLTIYGNDAYLSGGECDLEVDTYTFSRATGKQATDGVCLDKDITITAYELDNLGVWGERHTAYTVTVNLTDCDGKALEGETNVQRVYISGTTGVNNITLTDCDFLTKATAVYSNADGAIKAVNCSFTGGEVPFNINHKANGTQTVAVENCTFTNCGDAGDWKQFAAPLRLVNSGAGTQSAEVTGCAFAGTVGANGDILLGDGRTGQASNDVELKVVNTAANIQAQKPGYYGGETVDAAKKATATSLASGTLETSVAKLLPVNDGSEAHPYSREQFAAMTRAEYIAAQERLGGTLYVNVGDYAYEKDGVLGNGVRNDTPGQVPDHAKLNAYGENGYLGEKNDGANGHTVVFVGGTITSGVTGYTSIDNIGTSLLLAVPAYTKVTFEKTTFKNVLSFNYQLYTSPWSQLGGLTFNGCTFDGIIVGAIAAQELAFNGCTFNNYVNTASANNSNPTWIRPAYGNWTKGDNEGQGTDFRSLTNITFADNKVTSTRPVKFERIAQWEMATTVTATNNTFAITPQEGDKEEKKTKNVGLYFGANAKFDLVVDKNEKSGETAALYTAEYKAPTEVTYVGLPAGSTVKNAAGEEVATGDGDALAWKTTKKITLKTTTEVASVTNAKGVSVNFATLAEAIAAAQAGETVTLLADITLASKQSIRKELTLDLNGKTLTGTAYQTLSLGSGANVTIQDSSAEKTGKVANGYKGSADPYTICLDGYDAAALTLVSGTVEANPHKTDLQSVAINTNYKKDGPYAINIRGGKVFVPESSTNGRAIVAGENVTLTVEGGEIVGGLHGVDVYGGSTTVITGGSISARVVDTGVIEAAYGLRATGTASVTIGAADGTADGVSVAGIKMNDNGYKLDVPAVTVNSGTIAGPVYSITPGTIVFNVQATSEDVLRFADDTAAKFLPSNLELRAKDIDGKTMYYVAAKPVAAIGAIGYETLEAALAAAKDGETVKLLADVTESVTIAADRTLTLDLNGKMLSAGKASEALTVTGNLTIDDTSAAKSGRVVGDGRYAVYMNNRTAHVGEAAVGGSLTLNAGSLEGATYGVYILANQAAFTMNGGKVSATQAESIRVNNDYHAKTISLLSGEVGDVFLGSISSTELTTLTVGKADQTAPAAVKVGKIGLQYNRGLFRLELYNGLVGELPEIGPSCTATYTALGMLVKSDANCPSGKVFEKIDYNGGTWYRIAALQKIAITFDDSKTVALPFATDWLKEHVGKGEASWTTEALEEKAKNELAKWQCYLFGLDPNKKEAKVVATAGQGTDKAIPLAVANADASASPLVKDGYVTVAYVLMGSNDGTAWTQVATSNKRDGLVIPLTGTTYKFYRVDVTVTSAEGN